MAKPIILCSVVPVYDGLLPGECNLLALASAVEGYSFRANILPQMPVPKVEGPWKRADLSGFNVDAKPLREVLISYREWLSKTRGQLLAVTVGMDFWFVYDAFIHTLGGCPFSDRMLDLGTWQATGPKQVKNIKFAMGDIEEIAKEYLTQVGKKKSRAVPKNLLLNTAVQAGGYIGLDQARARRT